MKDTVEIIKNKFQKGSNITIYSCKIDIDILYGLQKEGYIQIIEDMKNMYNSKYVKVIKGPRYNELYTS